MMIFVMVLASLEEVERLFASKKPFSWGGVIAEVPLTTDRTRVTNCYGVYLQSWTPQPKP